MADRADAESTRSGYASVRSDPREYRSSAANRSAALALIGAIALVIVLIAVFQ